MDIDLLISCVKIVLGTKIVFDGMSNLIYHIEEAYDNQRLEAEVAEKLAKRAEKLKQPKPPQPPQPPKAE